jgi:prepilin-type N-terminal cleavage/methylation domain-containing protein
MKKGYTFIELMITIAICAIFVMVMSVMVRACFAGDMSYCDSPMGYNDRRCTGYYVPRNNANNSR